MIINAAQQFMNLVKKDSVLQNNLVTEGGSVDAIINFAARAGFKFDCNEFIAATTNDWKATAEELSDSDLEMVVGGGKNTRAAAGTCYTLGGGPDC